MENVSIFSKVSSPNENVENSAISEIVEQENTDEDQYIYINISIPNTEVPLKCIKLSKCRKFLGALNLQTNELVVYRYGEDGVIEPPCFNSPLISNRNSTSHDIIVGWDKTHLGKSHGLSAEENVALLQPAKRPLPESELCNLAWSRFQAEETFICVNAYTATSKRFLVVFDIYHGRLVWSWHESTYRHKLGNAVAWRPRCNQIAVPFQSNDCHYVGIWERGALVRGLPLGLGTVPVRSLEFSNDGSLLFVWQQMKDDEAEGGYVAIYLYSNGGWLFKQQVRFCDQPLAQVKWACALEYHSTTFSVKVVKQNQDKLWINCGLRSDVSLDGELVLINGRFVNITRTNVEVLPPGTCSLQLELPEPSICANKVFLHETKPWIAVLCDLMYLHLYDRCTGAVLLQKPFDMSSNRYSEQLTDGNDIWHYINQFNMFEQIENNFHNTSDNMVVDASSTSRQICSLIVNGTKFMFRLDFDGNLYIDNFIVSKKINSLCIYADYLCITAYKTIYYFLITCDNVTNLLNKCRCNFGSNGPPSVEAFANINLPFINQRPVEVNAKLITGSVGGLIMIMPRGNFEVLQIPKIGCRTVENLMFQKNYKEAVSTVHLLNLDPNVLIDNDIKTFVDNTTDFVKEISEQSLIHLLIELKDHPKQTDKRFLVCTAIHDALLASGSYEADSLPLLALTKLQMSSGQLCAIHAITYIGTFVQQAVKRGVEDRDIRSTVDSTLRALQAARKQEIPWFNFALRIGQLQVASMIASYLRMDPKVYEPFLDNIKQYAEDKLLYQHQVNKFLGNDNVALKTLLEWYKKRQNSKDDTNGVLEFIRERKLSRMSMDILINSDPCSALNRANIATLIADLTPDVANDLTRAGDQTYTNYASAFRERYNNHTPQMCKVTWRTDNWEENLGTQLSSEPAISFFVEDDQFKAAVSIASATKRKDLIETIISDGIAKRADNLCVKMNKLKTRYTKMYDRLTQVRHSNLDRFLSIQFHYPQHAEGNEDNNVFDDTMSMRYTVATTDASTATSVSSRTSSRRRRRDARKADKIREGHPREDINIMRVLHEDIHFVFEQTALLTELFEIKIAHPDSINGDVDLLIALTLKMQKEMTINAKEIWSHDLNVHLNPFVAEEDEMELKRILALQQNLNFLEMKFRSPPDNMKNIFKTINSENE